MNPSRILEKIGFFLRNFFLRIVVYCATIVGGYFIAPYVYPIISWLGYIRPADINLFNFFFGHPAPAEVFARVGIGGLFFGILGKKVDYIIVLAVFLLGIWHYTETPGVSFLMYFGLAGVALFGIVAGRVVKKTILRTLNSLRPQTRERIISAGHLVGERIGVTVFALVAGLVTSPMFLNLYTYRSGGFFGPLGDLILGMTLGWIFWANVGFSLLGKKFDYVFLFILFLFGLYISYEADFSVLLAFFGIFIVSALIGFGLKVLRQRFFSNKA